MICDLNGSLGSRQWPREGLFLFAQFKNLPSEQENKNAAQKTERDVRLLERFLKTRDEVRKIEDFSAVERNEYISQFIISVRTKDGTEYEPTSLRSLIDSFQRHLKKKAYSRSIINDLVLLCSKAVKRCTTQLV